MKQIKWLFGLIVIGFVALVIASNWQFLSSEHVFSLNLYFRDPYTTPPVANGLVILGCFLLGAIIAYISSLSARFQASRMIRGLQQRADAQSEELAALKREVDAMKPPPPAAEEPSEEKEDAVTPVGDVS